ncbi:AraC-type DNA-binding protein [Aquiflexum balticum DSM 16537]|uniref:AraC-type DNA-binding protein n=1 Tax=Aquiflexum balticum DSM 16537 TaxID=758820 RepID=A0A1W2H2G3_9BACT|nr:AraC family transcriptional regulator [Aquiflexum balticum]SMD42808.1 AraC-type DNA-binding protein [Aquiflexum balticum DSM 16537]
MLFIQMRIHIAFLFIAYAIICESFAQDTVFVQKHSFQTPLRNIFLADQKIHAKTGDGVYVLNQDSWEKIDLELNKSFVFYNEGFFQSEFVPKEYLIDAKTMAHLIPQKSLINCTKVHLNNQLFLSVGGSLFEYEIRPFYKVQYPGISIRNVYIDDQIKVISTYSGIFVNDTLKAGFPPYSNGNFTKINGKYFLSTDDLFKVISNDSVLLLPTGQNIFAGHSRKLVEWNNKTFSLNTNSINELLDDFSLYPIHRGFEYSDLEVFDSSLVFSTYEGKVFSFDGIEVYELADVGARIREIFPGDDLIYLAADNGAFAINPKVADSLEKILDRSFCVDVEKDRFKNLWIATENGLFIIPKSSEKSIPLVSDVEFNRYGMTLYNDHIYAGSINGLYLIDIYDIEKNFLPLFLQKVEDQKILQRRSLIFQIVFFGILILFFGFLVFRKLYARRKINLHQKSRFYSLEQIQNDIIEHKLISVELLASFYETNTVQLNRQFKNFGITPGKFLKTVKISWANQLLKEGVELDEVARRVGYSSRLLKNEFGHKS